MHRGTLLALTLAALLHGAAAGAQQTSAHASADELDALLEPRGASTEPSREHGPSDQQSGQGDLPVIALEEQRAHETEAARTPARTSRFVEEIVVTAQKREENVQDVPISVQAFSGEALDARGVSDAMNLPMVTPGMVYSSIANYSIIFIRGIGTDAFVPSADASIATYIDGIYFPFSHGLVQSFGAVERVEVLKGPQGTLFGRNSTGGAISVITKKPSFEPEVALQLSYASFDNFQSRAYVNIPLSDSFAFNVSALYNLADNHYELTEDAPRISPLPKENERGARIRAIWAPSDRFDITLSGLLVEQSGIGSLVNQNTNPNPQYRPLGVEETPPYRTSIDTESFSESRNPVIYGELNFRTDWFDTKLLASRQSIRTTALVDYDATKAPLVSFIANQLADVDTQELQILSNASTPGADWFKWIGGVYHIESLAGFGDVLFSLGRDFPAFTGILGALQNALDPVLGLTQLTQALGGSLDGLGTRVDIEAMGLLRTNSTAGFFQGTVQLPADFSLTLGGRYQTETRSLLSSRDQVQLTNTVAIPLFNFADQTAETSNFSPKIGLDWRSPDDMLIYASYQKGFKSGTYNILNIYTPTQFIEPETVTAYEIGFKSQLFDRRLQLNAAVFHSDIENLQVQFISLLSGGAVRFESADAARIRGAEFDLVWQIAPDTLPGLVATLNGAYLDARYTEYPAASGFTEGGIPFGGSGLILGGGVLPGRDFAGNRIVRSPEFSGTAGLSQTFDALRGTFEVAADLYYNSGYYYTAQNIEQGEEEAFSTLDARISYLHAASNVRLTLFGRNLTDTLYAINRLPTDIGTWTYYAPPATYGVRLQWSF
jgi:iron complex outermembrane recepter protein